MTQTNVELARRGYAAVLRGDLDAVRELLHPDVKWHGGDPSARGACRSREQVIEFMRQALSRRPLAELVDVIDVGEQVVAIMRPASGSGEPTVLSASLTTFRDGRAIEMVHYPDSADALAAAGAHRTA
jgi:ketosteroid isomerase-like protein